MDGGVSRLETTSGGDHTVFDVESEEWISFDSQPDALYASLYLEQRIPLRYLNTFLSLLRNPGFDSRELSFSKVTEIDEHIAEQRKTRASERANRRLLHPFTRLPYDVFENIVEQAVMERNPLGLEDPSSAIFELDSHSTPWSIRRQRQGGSSTVDHLLKSLSLVHRFLTPLAQRALGKRFCIHKQEDVLSATRSPLLGHWTRELVLSFNSIKFFGTHSYFDDGEVVDRASIILSRSPNLRYLRIRTTSFRDEIVSVPLKNALLTAVARLRKLETLCWFPLSRNGDPNLDLSVDVEDLCNIVAEIPSLRALSIGNAHCGRKQYDEPHPFLGKSHNLEHVSLTNIAYDLGSPPECLSWLFAPTIRSVTIDLLPNSPNSYDALTSSLEHILPNLHSITLRMNVQQAHAFAASSLGKCSSLQHLHVWIHGLTPRECQPLKSIFFDHIPHLSLETLHLSLGQIRKTDDMESQEKILVQSLFGLDGSEEKVYPNLKNLFVDSQKLNAQCDFSFLGDICKTLGCRFSIRFLSSFV